MKNTISALILGLLLASSHSTSLLAKDSHGHVTGSSVSAKSAIAALKAGNERFYNDKALHKKSDSATRRELAKGQKPHTIILSCSDSRVPPELIFDQGLGEVFPIRVAGNVISSQGVASIEYAIAHLGAKLLLVMGHESCGAVKAAIETPVGKSAGSYDLDNLVAAIRPNLGESRSLASEDKTLRNPVMSNVTGVACGVQKRSEIVRNAVKAGQLKVATAIYSLESGKVDFWDAECPGVN